MNSKYEEEMQNEIGALRVVLSLLPTEAMTLYIPENYNNTENPNFLFEGLNHFKMALSMKLEIIKRLKNIELKYGPKNNNQELNL